jgi:hypothetical protein
MSAGPTDRLASSAMRAYDTYLPQRVDPDPPLRPQHDSVAAERASLADHTTGR